MKIDQIIVVKETREGEGRVALTPSTVALLTKKHYLVIVESQAGAMAGFKDEEYIQAGARIFNLEKDGLPTRSLILRVKRPVKARELLENKFLSTDMIMMGFLDPFDVGYENHIATWQALGTTTVSLELLHLSADDPKNAQAAMSRFAGRLALKDTLERYSGMLPNKVSIFGTGPAGLGAAYYARSLSLPVQLFGRRERHREAIEKAGITYLLLPEVGQSAFIRSHLHNHTIILTAVRSIGNKSPLLIDANVLSAVPDNAIITDIATGEGGNVIGSKEDEIVKVERGISIVNVSGYPKAEPKAASEAFAECMLNLLLEIITPDQKFNFSKVQQLLS